MAALSKAHWNKVTEALNGFIGDTRTAAKAVYDRAVADTAQKAIALGAATKARKRAVIPKDQLALRQVEKAAYSAHKAAVKAEELTRDAFNKAGTTLEEVMDQFRLQPWIISDEPQLDAYLKTKELEVAIKIKASAEKQVVQANAKIAELSK